MNSPRKTSWVLETKPLHYANEELDETDKTHTLHVDDDIEKQFFPGQNGPFSKLRHHNRRRLKWLALLPLALLLWAMSTYLRPSGPLPPDLQAASWTVVGYQSGGGNGCTDQPLAIFADQTEPRKCTPMGWGGIRFDGKGRFGLCLATDDQCQNVRCVQKAECMDVSVVDEPYWSVFEY